LYPFAAETDRFCPDQFQFYGFTICSDLKFASIIDNWSSKIIFSLPEHHPLIVSQIHLRTHPRGLLHSRQVLHEEYPPIRSINWVMEFLSSVAYLRYLDSLTTKGLKSSTGPQSKPARSKIFKALFLSPTVLNSNLNLSSL